MTLPFIPPSGPGGFINDAMNANNALALNMLKRKYYRPDIESQINNRNALTEKLKTMTPLEAAELKLKNDWYEPNMQSTINNRNALTENYNTMTPLNAESLRQKNALAKEDPLLNASGPAGDIARLMYLKNHPLVNQLNQNQIQNNVGPLYPQDSYVAPTPFNQQEQNDYQKLIDEKIADFNKPKEKKLSPQARFAQDYTDVKDGFMPDTGRKQRLDPDVQKAMLEQMNKNPHLAVEQHQEKMANRKHWDSLTPDTKAHLVAIAQGGGIRGDEVERALSNGMSFNDLLYEHGLDPDNPPESIYELTAKNRSAQNEREYASREVKYLSNFINKATGNYANKVRGYNFNQVKDALTGKNEEQQAKFMAGRLLSPELVNLRLVLGGAKATVHAIKSMTEKAMLDGKIFESLVTNKVWHRTQEIAEEELNKAFSASKKGYGEPVKKSEVKNEKKPDFSKMSDEELKAYIGEE